MGCERAIRTEQVAVQFDSLLHFSNLFAFLRFAYNLPEIYDGPSSTFSNKFLRLACYFELQMSCATTEKVLI